jgi:Flp pilus assembly protein TadG
MSDPHPAANGIPRAVPPGVPPSTALRRGRHWRRFTADEGGSPAIEFALLAPIILMLLTGFVELGMFGLVTVLLEGSLRDVARYGITGQVPEGGDRVAHMLDMIAEATHGLVDVGDIVLAVRSYPTFEDVGQGEDFIDGNGNGSYDGGETFKDCNGNGTRDEDRGSDGTGGAGQVVVYRIDYDWPLWTRVLAPVIGHDGTLHIQANAVARNEPWDPDSAGRTPESCAL